MVTRKQVLFLLLFVLFIAEGTILPQIIPSAWQMRISANLVYVVILFLLCTIIGIQLLCWVSCSGFCTTSSSTGK